MSVEALEEYFSKWLKLTPEKREFISVLIAGQFVTDLEIINLLNHWSGEE